MNVLKDKDFLKIVGGLFAFISAIHLIRAMFSWDMMIGVYNLPPVWSYYAAFVTFFLSAVSFSLALDSGGRNARKKSR